MKRIIIVECPESAKDLPVTMVVFSDENRFLRADGSKIKEINLPSEQLIKGVAASSSHKSSSFIAGYNFLKSLLTCLLIAFMLTSCAVYPEPEPEVWQPRHTGTYQECDTVINGVTYYYFKRL